MMSNFSNKSQFWGNVESPNFAVFINKGCKSFPQNPLILNNLSLNIPQGCLYALSGVSGSGKSTILNCLMRLSKLDSGQLSIFGRSPSEIIKANQIGYMPQEVSLYPYLSVLETLVYFGKLFGVTSDLEENIEFLAKNLLLDTSKWTTLVGKLSGGQKKRISLAVALIHKPKLVILDEPTSGIDPLLRVKIWNCLKSLVKMNKVTVLVTTHYTDEVRTADMVGILRDGRLIAEEEPSSLLTRYETFSMDDAVFQLNKEIWLTKPDNDNKNTPGQSSKLFNFCSNNSSSNTQISYYNNKNNNVDSIFEKTKNASFMRIRTMAWKNWMTMRRNLALLLFVTLMPAVITLITGTTYRSGPKGIPISVVNFDATCYNNDDQIHNNNNSKCMSGPFSCKFIDELMHHSSEHVIKVVFQDTMEAAQDAVANGSTWGFIWFPRKFSASFEERILSGSSFGMGDNDEHLGTWNSSNIYMRLDQTNTLIHAAIITEMYSTLERFFGRISKECEFESNNLGSFPLQYSDPPLLGTSNLGVLESVTPGFAFGWLFFFSVISVSIRLIGEKKQGTLTRTLSGGTCLNEILVAYFVTEIFIVLMQSVFVLCVIKEVLMIGANCPNSLLFSMSSFLTLIVFLLGSVSGLCFGFLLGLVCEEETQAALLSIAIFFPNSYCSGIVWPLEGMPLVLQWISPFLPFTLPNETLQSLIIRGWEFTHPCVWPGFMVLLLYTMLYLIIIVAVTFKKNV